MTIPHPEALEVVRSPQNTRARRLRALDRDRSLRDREGLYLAWGLHLVQEALAARADLVEAWITPSLERTSEGREAGVTLSRKGVRLTRTTTRVLESIISGAGDQGVILVVRKAERSLATILGTRPTLLLLAQGVQDPGNLGAILRTAWALGAEAIVTLEGCADPFGSRAVRAAMGAHFSLPVACSSTPEALASLARADLEIVASDPSATEPPGDLDWRRPTALFLGGEGTGLSTGILTRAAHRVRVPMVGGVDSLNVQAAAAILLYEAARQRTSGLGGGRAG